MALRSDITRSFSDSLIGQQVVFFGNELLATGITTSAPLLSSLVDFGHSIEAVVLKGRAQSKKQTAIELLAISRKIPIYYVESSNELDQICDNFESEIAVLASFGMIVPQDVLNSFRFGIVNIHPSLLPLYRGSSPIEQAILDGATETGISFMQLNPKMDQGPLYLQEAVSLAHPSKQSLYEQLAMKAAALLPEVLVDIISGTLSALPQDNSRATYTKRINKTDGLVDWRLQADVIEKQVRAYAGWPKSKTTLKNIPVSIIETEVIRTNISPGDIKIDDSSIVVGTAKDSLIIKKLQPDGKKPMSAKSFINGYLSK